MVIFEFKSRFHGLLESRYVTTLYSTVYSEMIGNPKKKNPYGLGYLGSTQLKVQGLCRSLKTKQILTGVKNEKKLYFHWRKQLEEKPSREN